jgi:uncharacterized membrane protein
MENNMPAMRLGQLLITLGIIGLGVLGLIYDDFALSWQPVPASVPAHAILAYASALLLLVCGIALLTQRAPTIATLILTLFVFSWLILLQLPRLIPQPLAAYLWLGVGETLELFTGLWMLYAVLARATKRHLSNWMVSNSGIAAACFLFALSLPLVGLSHFVYAKETADMVPAWLPQRTAFAYLTGAGHVLAGIAIATRMLPRLAATLEAIMMSSFVLFVHLPGVIHEPTDRTQWTMLCVALSFSGAAWVIAHTFRHVGWLGKGAAPKP